MAVATVVVVVTVIMIISAPFVTTFVITAWWAIGLGNLGDIFTMA